MNAPVRARALPALLLLVASCGGGEKRPPVVVLGADGLEWSVAEALLKEGRMPNLQKLLDAGVGGTLQTMEPTLSPVLWTTIATGREPQDHGVLYFSEVGPNGPIRDGLPYTSESRRVPAIWNLADEAGKSVTAVAWWVSWPAERLQHGRVVASYAASVQGSMLWKAGIWGDGLPELTSPASLFSSIRARLEEGKPKGPIVGEQIARYGLFDTGLIRDPQEKLFLRQSQTNFLLSAASDRTHQQVFCDLLKSEVSDLNLLYLGATDVGGHLFWKFHEPTAFPYSVPQDQVAHFGPHIAKSYEDLDRGLGEILDTLPAERVVLLVADHGMRAYPLPEEDRHQRSGDHQRGEPGICVLSGPGVRRQGLLPSESRRLGHILDVAPMLCDLLGIPPLVEMRGNGLRRWMTEEWDQDNPALNPVRSPRFRAPLPPREPVPNASAQFLRSLSEIGYSTQADNPR